MIKRPKGLALVAAALIQLLAVGSVLAATYDITWTTQPDFEHNGFGSRGNPGPSTSRLNVETAAMPGSVFLVRNGAPNQLIGLNNLIVPASRAYVRDLSVAYDPSRNQYVAAWIESPSGLRQIHLKRLDQFGAPTLEGEITVDSSLYLNPVFSSLTYNPFTGHFLLLWQDPFPQEGIWAISLDANLNPLPDSKLMVNPGIGDAPVAACGVDGECLVAWQRMMATDYYVWARAINVSGQLSGESFMVSVNRGKAPALAAGASGSFLVVWDDGKPYFAEENIWGRMVVNASPAGVMETQVSDFEVGREYWPAAAYNGATNTFFVSWVDQVGSGADTNIFGRQVSADMSSAPGPQVELCAAPSNQVHPTVTYVEDLNQWIVGWWDGRFGYENWDIYVRGVNADDSMAPEIHVTALPKEDQEVAIAAGASGDALVLWRNTIDVGNTHDLWAQVIGRGYAPSGSIQGLKLNTGASSPTWGPISWTAATPDGSTLRFRTRSASKEAGLATAVWSSYYEASGTTISSPANRWLEIEMSLDSTAGLASPLVSDFTVTYSR